MEKGNNIEFMDLYKKYHGDLSSFCRSLEHDVEDAKELMSETVSRAYEGFGRIKDKRKFKSFLFGVAHNVLKEKIRKKNRVAPANAVSQPENTTKIEEFTIDQLLKQLPQEQAQVFSLFEIVDLPLQEIAEIQDTNISTVKTRLSRARKKLEDILKEEFTNHITNF